MPAVNDDDAVVTEAAARVVAGEAAGIVAGDAYIGDPNRSQVLRRRLRERLAGSENFQELDRLCGTILGINSGE